MKKTFLALSVLSLACTKSEILPPDDCKACTLVSYKYDLQWKLIGTPDTLWKDPNVCGKELQKVRDVKQIDTMDLRNCSYPFSFEIRKYTIK